MPNIEIRFFATLTTYLPEHAQAYPINAGMTVGQVLTQIQLPLDQAKLIFVDGVRAQLDTCLQGGERVGVFPPVGGG
jgi:sulfur-carrier protein